MATVTLGGQSELIKAKAVLFLTLESKQDWIRSVPNLLPEKESHLEEWLWVDNEGNTLRIGEDFTSAEELKSYPINVYRLIRATESLK